MVVYQVDLVEHCANGDEVSRSYLFDARRDILIGNFRTPHAEVWAYSSEIKKIKQVIKDPNDSQRHVSGFFIKEAKVEEISVDPRVEQSIDLLVQAAMLGVRRMYERTQV
jgi:hypothetical protein